MAGNQFKYDPNRLHYEKIERDLKGKVFRVFAYVFTSLVLSVLLVVLSSLIIDTPREREAKQEYEDLRRDYQLLSEKYRKIDTVLNELKNKDENIYRTIFEAEPLNTSESLGDHTDDYHYLLNQTNHQIIYSTVTKLTELLDKVDAQSVEYSGLLSNAGNKEEMLRSIPAIQPLSNKDLTRLASGYGYRMHPMYKIVRFHDGMDFTAPTGTEVYATGNGKVEELDRTRRGHGNTVVINHGYGYKSVYSHLDGFNVRRGQEVQRGEVIGWVGNTGLSVAPHLHYEVHLNGKAVNPVNYYFLDLLPEEYFKMIELSIKSGQSFD